MDEFLSRPASDNFRAVCNGLDDIWNGRARQLNETLAAQNLPVRVANLSSIWTVYYTDPFRYNWMLQYYLRAEGLALSWIGTGRFIFSLNYNDADFAEVTKRFVAALSPRPPGWTGTDAGGVIPPSPTRASAAGSCANDQQLLYALRNSYSSPCKRRPRRHG